jgi:hypothetical protein
MAKEDILGRIGFTLVPGVYQLSHDVLNRKPDRRTKQRFDTAGEWLAGTLIEVRTYPHDEFSMPSLRPSEGQGMGGELRCMEDNKDQWESLVKALVAPGHNYYSLIAELRFRWGGTCEGPELIAMLLNTGIVRYEKCLELGQELGEMSEEDYEAWRKRVMGNRLY